MLEDVRARLQRLLADDEYWRALMREPAHTGVADADARRARAMRLEMALADNGTYRAWRHVGEAIAALGASETLRPAAPASGTSPPTSASELPPHIADLLRRRAAEEARLAEARRTGERAAPAAAATALPPVGSPATRPQPAPSATAEVPPTPQPPEEASVTFVTREPARARGQRPTPLRERLRRVTVEPDPPSKGFAPSQRPNEEADVEIRRPGEGAR